MRIGVNARFLLKNKLEGIGWYTYHILKNMVHRYPEHQYVFFFDRTPDPSFIFNSSVQPVVVFPPARHPFLWYWWFEYSLPKALTKYNIDVFFSPDGFASLSTPIPQILVVHDLAYLHYPSHIPFWVRKYYQFFVPKQIEMAAHIIAVSKATKQDIQTNFMIPEQKISIAYNGVRDEFKTAEHQELDAIKNSYSRGKDYFLYVGAIHPRKNITNLILAFDKFKENYPSDVVLIIVGRKAWMTQEMEQAFDQSKHKKDIIFYPYLHSDQLAKLTAAAFYAVNPSFFEGFGVPVLEALYCDVPVMVSNVSSLPEVAGAGALYFNPDKVEEMTAMFSKAMVDPQREERIQLGRKHRQQFSWEKSTEIIYFQLVNC